MVKEQEELLKATAEDLMKRLAAATDTIKTIIETEKTVDTRLFSDDQLAILAMAGLILAEFGMTIQKRMEKIRLKMTQAGSAKTN